MDQNGYVDRYLHIALDEIERSNGHVSETTAENPTEGTRGVEGRRVHLDPFPWLRGRRDQEILPRHHRRRLRRRRRRRFLEIGGRECSVGVGVEDLVEEEGSRR